MAVPHRTLVLLSTDWRITSVVAAQPEFRARTASLLRTKITFGTTRIWNSKEQPKKGYFSEPSKQVPGTTTAL